MSKTPYEIRLEVLKLAQDQVNQRFFNTWEAACRKADFTNQPITEVPEFPSTEHLLLEAEKLKQFVDKADNS